MAIIVDPTNENVAIVDGEVGHALRVAKIEDASRPTVAELTGARIVGYGSFKKAST